jgi:hypothetical protein
VVGIDHDALSPGLSLRVDFVDGGDGTRVPVFVEAEP